VSQPRSPDEALSRWLFSASRMNEWGSPLDLVEAMAAGQTTARLNQRQRWALLVAVGSIARAKRSHAHLTEQLQWHAVERKRLRKAWDDMRQERDNERKRADRAERRTGGRPGCGKIPLGTAAEAQRYLEWRCVVTGEHFSDYKTYTCERGCEPTGRMAGVWHIGHVVPRAVRERQPSEEDEILRLTDYETAARHLRLADEPPDEDGESSVTESLYPTR
jgi:hypothetical protein